MNNNLEKAFKFYCENEMSNFMQSDLVANIEKLALQLDYKVNIKCVKRIEKKRSIYFLSIDIKDKQGNYIDVWDDGELAYAIELIIINRKNYVIFQTWQDDDFIETVEWISNHLKAFVKEKVKSN